MEASGGCGSQVSDYVGGQWGHFTERGRCAGRGMTSENSDVFSVSFQKGQSKASHRGELTK